MKNQFLALFVSFFTIFVTSCKKENKQETKQEISVDEAPKTEASFSLQNAEKTISWTAYKTTEKIPVKGVFKKVNITAKGSGNSAKEAINNAEFSIPVSSIFTSDSGRDYKIKKFFFGVMDKTELLSGKLVLENDSIGHSDITMNGVTKKLPFKYSLKGNVFSLQGTMNITEWQGEKALKSLNTVCKDLHKGADGVSKTWDEVAINIVSVFK